MARTAGTPSKIYVDEFDFSGLTNSAEISVDINLPEVTALGDTAAEFVEGIYNNKCTINGFFDATDDGYDEQMWTVIGDGTKHYIGVYPGTNAVHASLGYELQGQEDEQSHTAEVANAILLNVTWQGEGPMVRSQVLCNGAVAATGAVANSNKNLGATAAGERFVAIMRVLAVTGAGSITVDIEESSDDAVGDPYAQALQFTAATAIGVERKSTILATEAWKRVNVTAFSGFTDVTILITAGKEQGVS